MDHGRKAGGLANSRWRHQVHLDGRRRFGKIWGAQREPVYAMVTAATMAITMVHLAVT